MISSDLHGSAYYTNKVLEVFEREAPERMVLLGDILYHGPRNPLPRDYAPMEVAASLNAIKESLLCVRGNCDSEVDQMVLEFPIQADYAIWYEKGNLIFMTHGHIYDEMDNPPLIQSTDILLHGHTHVPVAERMDRLVYLNPGSAALPKDGYPHSYMMYEDGVFRIIDLMNGAEMMRYELETR